MEIQGYKRSLIRVEVTIPFPFQTILHRWSCVILQYYNLRSLLQHIVHKKSLVSGQALIPPPLWMAGPLEKITFLRLPLVPSSLPHLQTGKTYTPLFTRLIKSRTEPEPSIARLPIFPVTIHSTRYGNISLLNGQARTGYFRQGGYGGYICSPFYVMLRIFSPDSGLSPRPPSERGQNEDVYITPF